MSTAQPPSDENIKLEAPGDLLSGLLAISDAGIIAAKAGSVRVLGGSSGLWRLVAALSGRLRIAWGDSSWILEEHQAAAVPGGEELSLLPLADGEIGYLLLQGIAADRVLCACEQAGGLFFERGGLAADQTLRLLSRRQNRAADASGHAYRLLMELYGTGSRGPAEGRTLPLVVEAALGIMRREYAFLEGIGELADRLEVSQEYLTRSFCRYMGITPGKYLNQIRIENAKLLLRQGNHSVSFVSGACGFANSNYFARVFRAGVGMNPREYARREGISLPEDADSDLYVL